MFISMMKNNEYFSLDYWKSLDKNVNDFYVTRYVKFIKSIQKKGTRQLEYVEKHHIVPKSIDSSISDLIVLTYREHFIAHLILLRIFPIGSLYRQKMTYALHRMCYRDSNKISTASIVTSRVFEVIRKEYKKSVSGINSPLYGKPRSEEVKEKLRIANTGKTLSIEARKKLSESLKGRIVSEETRKKLSKLQKGHKVSQTTINAVIESNKRRKGYRHTEAAKQKMKAAIQKNGNYLKKDPKRLSDSQRNSLKLGRSLPASEKLKDTLSDLFKDSVWIYNKVTHERRRIKNENLQTYLSQGWSIGEGLVWINKNNKNKRIKFEELESYLTNDWNLGRIIKLSSDSKGRKWINNGKDCKFVKSDDLNLYISKGWNLGRLTKQ